LVQIVRALTCTPLKSSRTLREVISCNEGQTIRIQCKMLTSSNGLPLTSTPYTKKCGNFLKQPRTLLGLYNSHDVVLLSASLQVVCVQSFASWQAAQQLSLFQSAVSQCPSLLIPYINDNIRFLLKIYKEDTRNIFLRLADKRHINNFVYFTSNYCLVL